MPNDSMRTLVGQGGNVLVDADEVEEILALGPAVVYVAEVTGDYATRYVSPNVEAQTGYLPSDFIDDASFWASRIHPEDAPRIFAEVHRLFERDHHKHEYRFRVKDGSYRWMHDELKLVRDAHGEPLKIIGYWTDITERKEAGAAPPTGGRVGAGGERGAPPGKHDSRRLPNGWTVLTPD